MKWFRTKRIYMDYASAPPVCLEAQIAVRATTRIIGNPGAIHQEAVEAKDSLESSREAIARLLGVKSREVVFTSGLTDSNNLAIIGFARMLERTKRSLAGTHWLVSSIEHSSVLECFAEVERMGGEVSFLNPDARGIISPETLKRALKKETVFMSVGWANNELGIIQPLREMASIIRAHEGAHGSVVAFHADAGQAPLYLASTVHSLGVDLLSLGANKLCGPHGIGALYLSNRTHLTATLFGGKQERLLRPGTENVALAAGFTAAYEHAVRERDIEARRLKRLRDDFARELSNSVPGLVVNGDLKHALPHMLNVSIPEISSEYITLALDARGIALSTKSACREGEESTSHAVLALGGESWRAYNTLRFSIGRETRPEDTKRVVHVLCDILTTQRG